MKHTLQSFAATGIILSVNLATGILAARLLLPEGRGALAAIFLWSGLIAAVGSLTLNQSVTYFAASRRQDAESICLAALIISAGLSVFLVLAGIVVVPLALQSYGAEVISTGTFFVLFVPVALMNQVFIGYFQGALRIGTWNVLRVALPVAYGFSISAFFFAGHSSVLSFTISFFLAHMCVLLLCLILWLRAAETLRIPDPATTFAMLRYAVGAHIPNLVSIGNDRVSVAILALMLDPAGVGIFIVALSVAGIVATAAGTLGQIAFPKVASRSTRAEQAFVFGRYARATLFMTACGAGVLVIAAPWVVPLAFGEPFAAAVGVTQILIAGTALSAARLIFVGGLKAQGRLRPIRLAEVAGFLAQVVALVLLLPRFGVAGAAWAYVLSQTLPAAIAAGSVASGFQCSLAALLTPTSADWVFVRNGLVRRSARTHVSRPVTESPLP